MEKNMCNSSCDRTQDDLSKNPSALAPKSGVPESPLAAGAQEISRYLDRQDLRVWQRLAADADYMSTPHFNELLKDISKIDSAQHMTVVHDAHGNPTAVEINDNGLFGTHLFPERLQVAAYDAQTHKWKGTQPGLMTFRDPEPAAFRLNDKELGLPEMSIEGADAQNKARQIIRQGGFSGVHG